jgi:ribosomal protein S27AE
MMLSYNLPAPAKSGAGISTPDKQAHSAPSAKRRIFNARFPMAGCVGPSQDGPVPVAGSANPIQSAAICLAPVAAVPAVNRNLVMNRTCKKCGFTKPASDFYVQQKTECKECTKKRVRENRAANIDYYREFDRQRANLPHRVEARKAYAETDQGKEAHRRAKSAYLQRSPERRKESIKVWGDNNREKRDAHKAVFLALYHGSIAKQACESCGATKTQAHHDDYSKPLDVRWLCVSCHVAHHKAERAALNQAV